MAKAKKIEDKIILERNFNVPLRRVFRKVPKYKRSKRAIGVLKSFLVRHMKSDNIKIGKYANLKIWENGIKNPPHHIKIVAKKTEKGIVSAELEGAPIDVPPEPVKKKDLKAKPTVKDSTEDAVDAEFKKLEEKTEKIKVEKQEKAKEVEKNVLKELRTEKQKIHAPKKESAPKNVEQHPSAPAGKTEGRKP